MMDDQRIFLLLAPACLLALGMLLFACRLVLRRAEFDEIRDRQEFLVYVAFCCIGTGLALGIESLANNEQLSILAVAVAMVYLSSAWALNHAMCLRFEIAAGTHWQLAVGVLTLGGVWYFSEIQENLSHRILVLNAGIALVCLTGVPQMIRLACNSGALERMLLLSVLSKAGLLVLRAIWLGINHESAELVDLTVSTGWRLLLAYVLFFSLWFVTLSLVATMTDVVAMLRSQRDTDMLSRLPNRRSFLEKAERRLRGITGSNWYLIAVDIDHFKRINDLHGHAAGDSVIEGLGGLLERALQPGQLAGRMGGEEFMVLLDAGSLCEAVSLAESLRLAIESTDWPGVGRVTGSFGVEQVGGWYDFDAAQQRVDMLLYQAKHAGRNCVMAAGQGLAPEGVLQGSPTAARGDKLRPAVA